MVKVCCARHSSSSSSASSCCQRPLPVQRRMPSSRRSSRVLDDDSRPSKIPTSGFLVDAFAQISLKYMDVEGLFRKEGNAQRVKVIWGPFLGQVGIPESCNGHDICSLIKKFFRLLDEPILTWGLQGQFVQFAETIGHEETRLKCVLELCHVLPAIHRDTLAYTCRHLKKISERSGENKMDSATLGVVLAPSLFRDKRETRERLQKGAWGTDHSLITSMREDVGVKAALLDLLIRHAEEIAILTDYEKVMSPRMYECLLPEDDPQSPLAHRLYPGRRPPGPQRNTSLPPKAPSSLTSTTTSRSSSYNKGGKAYSVVKGGKRGERESVVCGEDEESSDGVTPSRIPRRKSNRIKSTDEESLSEKRGWSPEPVGVLDFDYESPRPDIHTLPVSGVGLGLYPSLSLTPNMEAEQMIERPILYPRLSGKGPSPKRKSLSSLGRGKEGAERGEKLYPDLKDEVKEEEGLSLAPHKSPQRKRDKKSSLSPKKIADIPVISAKEVLSELGSVLKASERKKMSRERRNTAPVKRYPLRRGHPNTLLTGLHHPHPHNDTLTDTDEANPDDSWLCGPLADRRFSQSETDLRRLGDLRVAEGSSGEESDTMEGLRGAGVKMGEGTLKLLEMKGIEAKHRRNRGNDGKSGKGDGVGKGSVPEEKGEGNENLHHHTLTLQESREVHDMEELKDGEGEGGSVEGKRELRRSGRKREESLVEVEVEKDAVFLPPPDQHFTAPLPLPMAPPGQEKRGGGGYALRHKTSSSSSSGKGSASSTGRMISLAEGSETEFGFEKSEERKASILGQTDPDEMEEGEGVAVGVRPSIAFIRHNRAGNVKAKAKLFDA